MTKWVPDGTFVLRDRKLAPLLRLELLARVNPDAAQFVTDFGLRLGLTREGDASLFDLYYQRFPSCLDCRPTQAG